MEREDFEQCLSTLAEISDLLIRMAGNAKIAGKVIAASELEKDYTMNAICVDDDEVVTALHDIALMKIVLENGQDWVEHLARSK